MSAAQIRWKRSQEGFVESHCGRWKITPEYWSCVDPQAFTLHHDGKIASRNCPTQRDAKETAERLIEKERAWGKPPMQQQIPARKKMKNKLTEEQWSEVFRLRCRSKEGKELSEQDRALVNQAFNENKDRYAALEPDVFDATVPFGSSKRWPR